MTDYVRKLAKEYLKEAEIDRRMERDYAVDKSNALLEDVMAEISEYGEVRSFEIRPLEGVMTNQEITKKLEDYWATGKGRLVKKDNK